MIIFTIGHSTHPFDKFVELLHIHGIRTLVDVRTYPGSRRHPQFNHESMKRGLKGAGIDTVHLKSLGGRRPPSQFVRDELVGGWTRDDFQNYAAHTFTDEYEEGIQQLLKLGQRARTAFLCSEVLPWKCHRQLIASTLVARGHEVWHIMSNAPQLERHDLGKYGPSPVVVRKDVRYPKRLEPKEPDLFSFSQQLEAKDIKMR